MQNQIMRQIMFFVALSLLGNLSPFLSHAAEVHVAVAANFVGTLKPIAAEFEKKSGHLVLISSASSGKLVAQIQNGAPFDLYLSADQESVAELVQAGRARSETRWIYARGVLVLWSPDPLLVMPDALAQGKFKHLAIAQPQVAPYGRAAQQVLERRGLWVKLQDRLVLGENIAQTLQFITSRNAELGLIALSQVPATQPKHWIVPREEYTPIRQEGVVLAKKNQSPAVQEFVEYLKSSPSKKIIEKSGYGLE